MYNQTISEIQVFKTNIQTPGDLETVSAVLGNDSRIQQWNVDCTDVDKVLRVQSDVLAAEEIMHIVIQVGFWCEELPD